MRWVHEIKFDGYRLQARVDRGRVKLLTRSGLDWTTKFGKKSLEALADTAACVRRDRWRTGRRGRTGARPDFSALQADLSEGRSDRFVFYVFDLLYFDGYDLRAVSLIDRKAVLEPVLLAGRRGHPLQPAFHRSAAMWCCAMPAG